MIFFSLMKSSSERTTAMYEPEPPVKAPINPITVVRVKKGQTINRSLDFFSHASEAAPEDGILIREDRGQKIRGTSIYLRGSDLKKIKKLKPGEELVVKPWEGIDEDKD
jgi:hypothetical protein